MSNCVHTGNYVVVNNEYKRMAVTVQLYGTSLKMMLLFGWFSEAIFMFSGDTFAAQSQCSSRNGF